MMIFMKNIFNRYISSWKDKRKLRFDGYDEKLLKDVGIVYLL